MLRGYRRSFNKISRLRGCEATDAFDVPVRDRQRFRRGSRNLSLALGTVADIGGRIEGVAIGYPADLADEVLADTDRREGWFGDAAADGYIRRKVELRSLGADAPLPAFAYLSNPCSPFAIEEDLSLVERARLVISATPRVASPGSRESGIEYLEAVRRSLATLDILDPHLEELAHAVRGEPGPWIDLVEAPRLGAGHRDPSR